MLLQAPAAPKANAAKANAAKANAAKPKALRLQQDNRSRLVHLAVLHDLGRHEEATQFIRNVLARSNETSQSYQSHYWWMYNRTVDPNFGDL